MNRTQHVWDVQLQREDGELVSHEVRAFWDPEQDGMSEFVANTAQAEAYVKSGKRFKFAPIAAILRDERAAA